MMAERTGKDEIFQAATELAMQPSQVRLCAKGTRVTPGIANQP